MSYLSSNELSLDPIFKGRLTSALTEQASIYMNDARPEFVQLAEKILLNPTLVLSQFTSAVSVQPGFNEAPDQGVIEDGQILAAVQAVYPVLADVNYSRGDAMTDAIQHLFDRLKAEGYPAAQLGGIYANKAGYHNQEGQPPELGLFGPTAR